MKSFTESGRNSQANFLYSRAPPGRRRRTRYWNERSVSIPTTSSVIEICFAQSCAAKTFWCQVRLTVTQRYQRGMINTREKRSLTIVAMTNTSRWADSIFHFEPSLCCDMLIFCFSPFSTGSPLAIQWEKFQSSYCLSARVNNIWLNTYSSHVMVCVSLTFFPLFLSLARRHTARVVA